MEFRMSTRATFSFVFSSVVVVLGTIACPFAGNEPKSHTGENRILRAAVSIIEKSEAIVTPSYLPTAAPTASTLRPFCTKNNGGPAGMRHSDICFAVESVKKDFAALIKGKDPVFLSNLYGAILRIAFHDAGEIDLRILADKAGPDGCLSLSSNNFGIVDRSGTITTEVIEPMWQDYCDQISRGDFWALIGKLALEAADPTGTVLALSMPFYYGRVDRMACEEGNGRLPIAEKGFSEIKRVFVDQMGMTEDDAGRIPHALIVI
jgi:hypothetical protein